MRDGAGDDNALTVSVLVSSRRRKSLKTRSDTTRVSRDPRGPSRGRTVMFKL